MTTGVTINSGGGEVVSSVLEQAGRAANHAAGRGVFAEYQARKAARTLAAHRDALRLFESYLAAFGIPTGDLFTDSAAWRGLTWGLVAGFVKWQLEQGYALESLNLRLSAVKTYAQLAAKAGTLSREEFAMIRTVSGYRHREAKNMDDTRPVTRRGSKKAEWSALTDEQQRQLKSWPNPATAQGRRDRLILHLLLDLGLRVGELAGLTVADIDLAAGELHFYRPKVNLEQTHKLSNGVLRVVQAYMAQDAPAIGPLLRGSRKDGTLTTAGMSVRAISAHVRTLGRGALGLENLGPHDLRHAWATKAARNGTPIDRLQQAGGWSSYAMPLRYIKGADIANQGVKLGEEGD
jgi:integrase